MTNKMGKCMFCGQQMFIEAPEQTPQLDIDQAATLECDCTEAMIFKGKKAAEERHEIQKRLAMDSTSELFHDDFPEVELILNDSLNLLLMKKIKKVVITISTNETAQISIKEGNIKVERIEKIVHKRETGTT